MNDKQFRILTVDDEQEMLDILHAVLHIGGHEVLQAKSGRAGLQLAQRERPDIMLLDLDMPGMDGLQVLRALQESPQTRDIPVIILTGSREVGVIELCFQHGAHDYVSKPINVIELRARVRHVVRLKQAEAALKQARDELEERVKERTTQLTGTNEELRTDAGC